MRRHLMIVPALATLALLGSVIGGGAVPAQAERAQLGELRLLLDGDFSPHALPRHREAPVTVRFDGSISTTDGSRPPALRRLRIGLNRNGRFSAAGLASCRPGVLQSSNSDAALRRCRPALVGGGSFRAAIESERAPIPVRGRLLVFNASRRGRPALVVHLYAPIPIEASFVLPLAIERRPKGVFGTVLATRLPRLVGGLGSITDIHLRIGRTYRHRGERRSLISAACAAPAGFSIALFPFARADFGFEGGRRLDVTLTRSCRVR